MLDHGSLPSLPSLRAFEAAARHGSFARAAKELKTTAASVSYHVRQLEMQLGIALFERQPHRVDLTETGKLVASEASRAFDALRLTLHNAVERESARLTISALPTFGTSWLTPRLGKFRALHPDLQVDLDLSAEPRDLGAGSFDAAIRNGYGDWPGLCVVHLFPSIFMPLCAASLKEAATSFLDCGEPSDLPMLGRLDWWRTWYLAAGIGNVPGPDQFGLTLADEHLDAAAAIAGHGVTIGSPILLDAEIEAGRLVTASDYVAADGRAFWLAYPAIRGGSRKVGVFRAWLEEEAALQRIKAAHFLEQRKVAHGATGRRA
jgi:LysR family transcriptional regulator, glycine cleavage system transcriptional activator